MLTLRRAKALLSPAMAETIPTFGERENATFAKAATQSLVKPGVSEPAVAFNDDGERFAGIALQSGQTPILRMMMTNPTIDPIGQQRRY